MEEHDLALAHAPCGDEWRAVREARPHAHFVREIGRIGEDLTVHGDIARDGEPGEQALVLERRERLRRRPGKRAAERASAHAQADGQEVVAAFFEPRSGKAHQHAALVHPFLHARAEIAGKRADVGHDEDRRALIESTGDGAREVHILLSDQLRERRERALDVVERRQ